MMRLTARRERAARPRLHLPLLLLLGPLHAAFAQELPVEPPSERPGIFRLIKRFDFDERPRGNFEDTPMHWARLTGPGLPRHAVGRIDDHVGHEAAPAFLLSLQGGSVGYEYEELDLAVVPGADYRIVGYVQPVQLRSARAFVAARFVSRFGETIRGSEQVSNLVGSRMPVGDRGEPAGDVDRVGPLAPEAWQRVELAMSADDPDAFALRLQLWVLQEYVWRDDALPQLDPIRRQDVTAAAWFDDLAVYRYPRVRLRLSAAANVVAAAAAGHVEFEVNNPTQTPIVAQLDLIDAAQQRRRLGRVRVAADETDPHQLALPRLEPGMYRAELSLHASAPGHADEAGATAPADAGDPVLRRGIRFAVMPELPGGAAAAPELGITFDPWGQPALAGVRELLKELGAGVVRLSVPMVGAADFVPQYDDYRPLGELVRQLAAARIETCGNILALEAALDPANGLATRVALELDRHWPQRFGAILAHFNGLVTHWQVGAARREDRAGQTWDGGAIERLRAVLGRSVTRPTLLAPAVLTDDGAAGGDEACVLLPGTVPASAIPRQLAFLAQGVERPTWIEFEALRADGLDARVRLSEFAKRLVLAKALEPKCLLVPAPFELSRSGATPAWQPTEEFLTVRAVYRALAGKRAVDVMRTGAHGVAVLFEGYDDACLVIWTDRDEPEPQTADWYLGGQPQRLDLYGDATSVPMLPDGRVQLRVTPEPALVTGIDAPLARLHASFSVTPTDVQIHQSEPRPTLRFTNHYRGLLSGEVRLTGPAGWEVRPTREEFELAPGQPYELSLDLKVPPRQVATRHRLLVELVLRAPAARTLTFDVPLTLGLRDVRVTNEVVWRGNDLLVTHSVRNVSDQPLSFAGFCQAPGVTRLEAEFVEIPPGQTRSRTYLLPAAVALRGQELWLGLREVNGPRVLDQLVIAPP